MDSYFDDFTVGDTYRTPGRTVLEADVAAYSMLSGDYDEKHTNVNKFGGNGRRPAPHMLLFAICHGLLCRTGILEGLGGVAFAGVDAVEFLTPVYVGDTIYGNIRIAEKRLSRSKPDRGLVFFDYTLVNQHGEAVQHSVQKLMRLVRGAKGGAPV